MNARKLLAAMLIGTLAFAAAARAGSIEELKKRIRQRRPILVKLKAQKKLGETIKGYVDAVKEAYLKEQVTLGGKKITIKAFVQAENADRKTTYEYIAKKRGIKPEAIASQQAKTNFERAKKGELLKGKDGKWVPKK